MRTRAFVRACARACERVCVCVCVCVCVRERERERGIQFTLGPEKSDLGDFIARTHKSLTHARKKPSQRESKQVDINDSNNLMRDVRGGRDTLPALKGSQINPPCQDVFSWLGKHKREAIMASTCTNHWLLFSGQKKIPALATLLPELTCGAPDE